MGDIIDKDQYEKHGQIRRLGKLIKKDGKAMLQKQLT